MDYLQMFLDSILVPETAIIAAFLIILIFLWICLRRLKTLRQTLSILEEGHLEWAYQSSEMKEWRLRLLSSDPANMKDMQSRSREILDFFDRLGFLMDQKILSRKVIWPYFGYFVMGYFSFLYPYIDWLRTEERNRHHYSFFEELNTAMVRMNRKVSGRKPRPLMIEEELKRFIEEEKTALRDI
ncbi:MAG TPA: hypothetical protein VK564_01135 [Thermodesulfobacteriota bacterium]|nr:hypothetical protein [Thermodesulfobacteriota bacterium]